MLPAHHCWVEVCGGAVAVTIAKARAPIEVINDADGEVVNALRQIRDHPEELARMIELTPYAKEELDEARKRSGEGDTMERARRFLVSAMMSVNGVVAGNPGGFSRTDSYARNGREARADRWAAMPEKIWEVTRRLQGIRIENRDAIDLVKMYSNRPATLLYVDPPYLGERTSGYRHEQRDGKFHEELIDEVLDSHAMVVMSGYASRMYCERLEQAGWTRRELATTTQDTTGERRRRRECLWLNVAAWGSASTGKPPIVLSAKEQRDEKVNPRR